MRRRRRFHLLACALALTVFTRPLFSGEPAAVPAAITVIAAPADSYKTRVKFTATNTPDGELVLSGSDGALEFKVSATSNKDATIRIEGTVKDYYGHEIPDAKLTTTIVVKAGKPGVATLSAKPMAHHVGPYFFAGTWSHDKGDSKGTFRTELGQSNTRALVNDFEELKYKLPGAALENSPAAQRKGQRGLIARIPKALEKNQPALTQTVPLNAALPGRPVKISLWIRSASAIRLNATLRDANATTWNIGPQTVEGGEWRYIEIPVPQASSPAAEDAKSIRFPLTLESLVLTGNAEQSIFIDELEAATQSDLLASFTVAKSCSRAPVSFSGWRIHQGGTLEAINNRKTEACIFPAAGTPVEFTLAASAFGSPKSIHFEGTVRDYLGAELPAITLDLAVKSGEFASQSITIIPTEKHSGPYYLNGTWSEVKGPARESVSLVFGQANWRKVIADFEQIRYPDPGGPLENSATAKHRGESGLIVRTHGAKQTVPLNLPLNARPAKIGFWAKSAAPIQASMRVRDPGINHMGGMRYDSWTIGPVDIAPGEWRYIEIPMPDYGPPKALRKSFCEANGLVDYPLTLEELEFSGPAQNEVFVDDVELWAHGEQTESVFVRADSSKASSLLYKTDSVNVVVSNAWLWGETRDVTFFAALADVSGKLWPLATNKTEKLAPGTESIKVCATQLPLGPYRVVAEAKVAGVLAATVPGLKVGDEPPPDPAFLVYEPAGKPLAQSELHALLKNRNRLIAELGITKDNRMFPWHSTQNSPAMENYTGYFHFEWLMPDIKARRDAGLEVVGTLGFTPQFYDPSARFITNYTEWFGSTVAMPSRSIYFEEYAHRTIDYFSKQVSTWIVWDRPDAADFATPEDYTEKMLEVARLAALEANPNSKLISGGITRENMDKYLTGMIEAGAHRYVDGIGILPSPAPLSPEDGYLDVILARAQRLRKQEHVKAEFWVLNLGWSSGEGNTRVTELEQAMFIPRAYVICRAQGIENILIQPDGTEATAKRDSADLIYPHENLLCLKPAALSVKTVQFTLKDATFVRELFLNDSGNGMTRAYLFKRPDEKLLLAAWRREGASTLSLASRPEFILDAFGNRVPLDSDGTVTLRPSPQYLQFAETNPAVLIRQLERGTLNFEDAPESAWKRQFTFHLDVGSLDDEKAASYRSTESRVVGPIDSNYHTDYGRHVVDSGRHFKGEESFLIDVSKFEAADLLLRKRINYSLLNQLVKVYCNGEFVGQWAAPKRDLRYRWRDIEYVVPNKFFAGKPSAALRFVAQSEAGASSYYYWAGPLKTKTLFLSDLSLLYGTAGGAGPMVSVDKNILGAPITFFKKPDAKFAKGIGTNAGARLEESLVVLSLNKQFKRLRGTVGIDTVTNGRGTVRFTIGGLSKTLWQSPDMTYYSEPKEFDIDVSNEIILTLSVNDTGDGPKDDIANWAGLKLELK